MPSASLPSEQEAADVRVLLVSSSREFADQVSSQINIDLGFEVRTATSLADVEGPQSHRGVDVYLLDLVSAEEPALGRLIDRLAAREPHPSLIVLSGSSGGLPIELAGRLEVLGATLLERPVRRQQLMEAILSSQRSTRGRDRHADAPTRVLVGRTIRFETRCRSLFGVLEEIALAAAHQVTLLIVGETGSGKTTLAQLVHELSPRNGERFMHLACGALPASLIESELFGHVRGAFTGADRNKEGKFEAVGEGTLLLDEIDSLSLEQQAKLLRVIETGAFEPVGSNETRQMRARLIVASNVSLETLVENDRFRKDLYYRLNVLRFPLPPLRDRTEDVVPMAMQFVSEVAERCRVPVSRVHPDFLAAIRRYHWPGNIRELKNCMERSVILCRGNMLTAESLPPAIALAREPRANDEEVSTPFPRATNARSLNDKIANSELVIIEESLRRNNHKRAAVARELGISRVTLYNKMKRYGLL